MRRRRIRLSVLIHTAHSEIQCALVEAWETSYFNASGEMLRRPTRTAQILTPKRCLSLGTMIKEARNVDTHPYTQLYVSFWLK
jgi:hypothetical protein